MVWFVKYYPALVEGFSPFNYEDQSIEAPNIRQALILVALPTFG
jgi:hypothetical protein